MERSGPGAPLSSCANKTQRKAGLGMASCLGFGNVTGVPNVRSFMTSRLHFSLLLLLLATGVAGSAIAAESVPPDHAASMGKGLDLFSSDVGKLLDTHCVRCHGGEKGTKGGLDLTTREGLMKGGENGPSIEPGKPGESLLVKSIRHQDEDIKMPKKEDKLPDDAIAKIAAWVDFGAPYAKPLAAGKKAPMGKPNVTAEDRQFWSFRPLSKPALPEVKNAGWVRTPIDRFVEAKLEENNLAPNPEVDRRSYIRRASFDLLGLPPTPERVEQFVHDTAPDAYEKLIDELLASPHYGERWGRHWLDLARYAESHGYEQDYDRPNAYHYRDFVIRALNEDLPYDKFVRWQIAGDELAPQNMEAWKATGFLAAGTHATQITANQAEKERYDELDDLGSTIGTSMLGLTVGCARCHDHKYDPIPTADYYRLISAFTTTVRSDYPLDLEPEKNRALREAFDREHRRLTDARAEYEKNALPAKFESWLKAGPAIDPARWVTLDFEKATASSQATFHREEDGSYLVNGFSADQDVYTITTQTTLTGITAIRLEALADASMVKRGPGRAGNGNFALSNFTVTAAPADGKGTPVKLKLVNPKATFEQKGLPVAAAIDGDKKSAWAIDPQFGRDHAAVFELEKPAGFEGGTTLTFVLEFKNNAKHSIGRPRISISTAPLPAPLAGETIAQALLEKARAALAVAPETRSESQRNALLDYFKRTEPEWNRLTATIREHEKSAPKPELTKVLICREGVPAVRLHTQGPDFYDKTFILKRGDLNQKQAEAPQGFLQVLMRDPELEKRWVTAPPADAHTPWKRASLAKWITDPDAGAGPLLARVIVNRLWQHHFGRGIVATPSDFGAQGDKPTHPELLEWLAGELVRNHWQLKPLHRLMMLSAVYRESSDSARADGRSIDPNNALFWHRPRHRLEGEAIRDTILAVSGTLDETMFGPGTLDQAMRRRSIYFQIKRSQLPAMLAAFDSPDTLQSMGLRPSTTVAPQSLLLMNNPQIRAAARAWAARLSAKPVAEAVTRAYLEAFSREPSQSEVADVQAFISAQAQSYTAAGKADAAELALTDFCQALFGLNEFVYID
jgi:mono/diheme cytochrome c family protein